MAYKFNELSKDEENKSFIRRNVFHPGRETQNRLPSYCEETFIKRDAAKKKIITLRMLGYYSPTSRDIVLASSVRASVHSVRPHFLSVQNHISVPIGQI